MLTRTISGAVLLSILLLAIIPGGDVTLLFCAAISLIGLWELYRVVNVHKTPFLAVGFVAVIAYYGFLRFPVIEHATVVVSITAMILFLFFYVFSFPKYDISQISTAFLGIFYVAVMISCIYLARTDLESGKYTVWLVIIISWGADTMAYFAGSLLGKHKMAPVLSPKKSIEGAIGGIVGAMLITLGYCNIFHEGLHAGWRKILLFTLIAGVGAFISMIGDLAASAIKRNYEIKDFSHLIPGHGGILDRFDSVIITAPIVYFFTKVFLG